MYLVYDIVRVPGVGKVAIIDVDDSRGLVCYQGLNISNGDIVDFLDSKDIQFLGPGGPE